jgi:hypothetical protein
VVREQLRKVQDEALRTLDFLIYSQIDIDITTRYVRFSKTANIEYADQYSDVSKSSLTLGPTLCQIIGQTAVLGNPDASRYCYTGCGSYRMTLNASLTVSINGTLPVWPWLGSHYGPVLGQRSLGIHQQRDPGE